MRFIQPLKNDDPMSLREPHESTRNDDRNGRGIGALFPNASDEGYWTGGACKVSFTAGGIA